MRRERYLRLFVVGLAVTFMGLSLTPAGASSANISHSYKSSTAVHDGSLVSLDPKLSDYVQQANVNNGSRLLGIAVNGNDSLIAVDDTPGGVQVATSGTANGLVSTLGGDIKVGDQVAVSPFDGVGMKAQPGSRVIGLAQTSFNASSVGTTQQVADKNGKNHDIRVGYVRISIAIGVNASSGTADLTGLQKLVQSITGHTVSNTRVIASLMIVVVSFLALITLVYASIYGSIVSVGRNPLAKYAVFRTLGSVLGMAVLTTCVAGATVFLLLR